MILTSQLPIWPVITAKAASLRGLIFCAACGLPLHPMRLPEGRRAYRGVCGCRLGPVDADTVERLVADAAEREVPAVFGGVPAGQRAVIVRRSVAAIRLGGTVDDLSIVWRT
ncbi:hypothetical protein GCM10022251_79760 [Phytohabitans flavus]|uniref:Recombinase zinc beta ribbon domain-containing protein n=1 Tax=Phytohabitans flavus TaxID=1076124 RepID=A0A6F8Y4D7_9ACTN|nr:hypothetical protein Pflav_073030 [Phytohabitans flavus]